MLEESAGSTLVGRTAPGGPPAHLAELAQALGTSEWGSVPVQLGALADPKLLWVNPRAKQTDPAYLALGRSDVDYRAHLLSSCAWVAADESEAGAVAHTASQMGYADRYGGSGVGRNGGSGRTVTINGYLVKGVGRTPLVSQSTDAAHASGGAYLEEAVRETIYAEIHAAEFPHSAVPVLAIIDTGLVQHWPDGNVPKAERRVLMVRPCVLRGAHFERALGFDSGQPQEGQRDARRVQAAFEQALGRLGPTALEQALRDFGIRLAEQLAYGFAHRLCHGSPNSSNTTLDGKLLDFGAASALPSWADVATMLTRRPFERQFDQAAQAIASIGHYARRYLAGGDVQPAKWIASARQAFKSMVTAEVLRVLGLPDHLAQAVRTLPDLGGAWPPVARMLAHFQQEHLCFVDDCEVPSLLWDVSRVWETSAPPHLRSVQGWLYQALPPQQRDAAQALCAFRSQTRDGLFKHVLRQRTFEVLGPAGEYCDSAAVGRLIHGAVAAGRRDFPSGQFDVRQPQYDWDETGGWWTFGPPAATNAHRFYEWSASRGDRTFRASWCVLRRKLVA